MSIQIACPGCGHDYNLSDALQGKKIRCKKCEEIFTVNGAAKPVADDAIEPADKPRPGPRAAAPPPGRRRGAETAIRSAARTGARPVRRRGDDEEDEGPPPSKKGAAPKSKSNKMPLIIGGAVLGVVLLAGAVVGAIFLLKGGDDDSNTQVKKSNPSTQPTSSKTTQLAGGQETVKKNDGKQDGKDDLLPANPIAPVAHPESQRGSDTTSKAVEAPSGQLSQDVVERVKKSTVYIEVNIREGTAS